MTATALFAALATAGACVMGYPATQDVTPTQAAPRPEVAKPAVDQGPLMIQVDVVDSEGHRLPGADVVVRLFYSRGSGNAEPVIERTKTDGAGHVRLEVARERPGAVLRSASVWAYQPGRALATSNVLLTGKASPPAIRLTLNDPAKWTITVLGPDERPIGRLRLVPHSFQRTDGRTARRMVVDAALEEPLTVTTDDKGIASLAYLDANMAPLSIGIVGAGFAPHTLPLDTPLGKNVVLKLGRPGAWSGSCRTASGQPLAGVPVELWVQGSGTLPGDIRFVVDGRITGDAIIRLDQVAAENRTTRCVSDSIHLAERFDLPRVDPERRVRTLHFQLGYAEWRTRRHP